MVVRVSLYLNCGHHPNSRKTLASSLGVQTSALGGKIYCVGVTFTVVLLIFVGCYLLQFDGG